MRIRDIFFFLLGNKYNGFYFIGKRRLDNIINFKNIVLFIDKL